MQGEVVFQVKVSRKDVYDAVRNLLLNEFKVLPHDLTATVDQRVSNKLDMVLERMADRYEFAKKFNDAIDRAIAKCMTNADQAIRVAVNDEIRRIVGDKLIERVVAGMFAQQQGK